MHQLFAAIETLDVSHLKACAAHINLLIKLNDVVTSIESTHAEDSDLVMSELKKFGMVLPSKSKLGRKAYPNSTASVVRSVLEKHGKLHKRELTTLVAAKFPNVDTDKLMMRINSVRGIEKSGGVWKMAA